MSSSVSQFRLRSWPLALLPLVAACGSLLGIEDVTVTGDGTGGAALHGGSAGASGGAVASGGVSNPTSGSGNESASGGRVSSDGGRASGGSSATAGESATGGKNTTTGGAPSTGGSAGRDAGGDAGLGGGGDGGAGPSDGGAGAGGATNTDTTVRGTIIDYYGTAVPNVAVTIGAETTQTDANGKFEIADVAPTYDVLFVVQPTGSSGESQPYTWLYEGLTRRDPTLQVYRGLAWEAAKLTYTITNGSYGNPPYTIISLGAPHGMTSGWISDESDYIYAYWAGGSKANAGLHVLRFNSADEEIATSFDAYYTQSVALDVNTPTTLSFDFPNPTTPISTGTVSGAVTSAQAERRYNSIYLRFADNAMLPVVNGPDSTTDEFSYLVPVIPNSELTFAACYGYYGANRTDAVACAYKPVTVGQNNVALTLPATPSLVTPAMDAPDISESTSFQWTSNARVFVFRIQDTDTDFLRGAFVVTSKKQTKIPLVGGSFPLRRGVPHEWFVQVHGDLASVDEAARPGGFMGSFAWRALVPQRYFPNDSGVFLQSTTRVATTAAAN